MTELTDHAKTILRAIADGKVVERLLCNIWHSCNVADAGSIIEDGDELTRLRVKPETRRINGIEFAAPVWQQGQFAFSETAVNNLRSWAWPEAKDRDTAYQAIVDALEGKSK